MPYCSELQMPLMVHLYSMSSDMVIPYLKMATGTIMGNTKLLKWLLEFLNLEDTSNKYVH